MEARATVEFRENEMECLRLVLHAIKPWQTLIGGLIAIVAALLAVWNTTRTLRNAERLEQFRRSKKRQALRAVLPLVLSEVSDYAEKVTDELAEMDNQCDADKMLHHNAVAAPSFPSTPVDVIASLKEFIELADDDIDTKVVVSILRRMQVLQARARGLASDIRSNSGGVTLQHYIETLMLDSATIYAMASACFDYGRGKSESLPTKVDWGEIRSALNVMGCRDFEHATLHEHLDALAAADADPGLT